MDEDFPLVPNFGFNPILDYEYGNGSSEMSPSDRSLDVNFGSEVSPELESPTDDGDFSETVLNYINQMLMEEDMDAKPCMFHDPLALQAAENSLYEVLAEESQRSPDQHPLWYTDHSAESPDDSFISGVSDSAGNASYVGDRACSETSMSKTSIFDGLGVQTSSWSSTEVFNSFGSNRNGLMTTGSNASEAQVPSSISQNDFMLQFKRGIEEGNSFLPKPTQLFINLEDGIPEAKKNVVRPVKDERENSAAESREMKNHERDESDDYEGERSHKQLAVSIEESEETELSELFDKVLLCDRGREERHSKKPELSENNEVNKSARSNRTVSNKSRARTLNNTDEVVDLRALLISCAQAVSSCDLRAADELVKKIREYSSPLGDGSQRLAHYFANGLEARLAGTGSEIYAALASKKTSATDMLKAYQAYISACPFKKMAIIFANIMILKTAEKAEKTLHIVDFGILYGFQWPAFIYYLSKREGGPPKLRMTGIELPQRGFRPEERVQETGHRLARYCERFGVQFEYEGIAKKFEDVRIEDIRIEENEVLAVSSMLRFKNLLDETVDANSPRDAVLRLIRSLKPDIFVHGINNGSHTAPFFVPRFREALFNFSAFFDLADATFGREDAMRLMFEKEFLGREIVNVVACEGPERVERPETYKQWQVRTLRAGFKPLPLASDAIKKLKGKVEKGYHSEFVLEEDANWMLQGWKGRVLFGSSCWVPA